MGEDRFVVDLVHCRWASSDTTEKVLGSMELDQTRPGMMAKNRLQTPKPTFPIVSQLKSFQ